MRSWTDFKFVFCAVCVAGSVACSDDDADGGIGNPQGNGGTAGAAGSAGAGGAAAGQGGAGGGAMTAGSGGSAGAAAGAAGSAGAPGVAPTPDAGIVVGEPDAGGVEPDAGAEPEPEPEPEAVTFADAFPVLVARCGNCHGANAPGARPRFAIAADQAASLAATRLNSQGALVSARLIIRIDQGSMPPACDGGDPGEAGCVSVAEAALLSAWVDQGAQP